MLKKEVKNLFILGFLDRKNDPEWGAPSFAQSKPKTN